MVGDAVGFEVGGGEQSFDVHPLFGTHAQQVPDEQVV